MSVFMGRESRWDADDLGCLSHTALRKACDSDITSIAYNLISGLGSEWTLFLRQMEKAIRSGKVDTSGPAKMAASLCLWIEDASDPLSDEFPPDNRDESAFADPPLDPTQVPKGPLRSLYQALVSTFTLFSDSDWSGFVAYYFD